MTETWNLSTAIIQYKPAKAVKSFTDIGMWATSHSDLFTKYVGWYGLYRNAFEAKYWRPFNLEVDWFKDTTLVKEVDLLTSMSLGSKDPVQLPKVLQNSTWRVALALQSFVVKRYSQLAVYLPEVYWVDKKQALKNYTLLATTAVLQSMVSPAMMGLYAYMGLKEDKEYFDRFTWVEEAEFEDILFTTTMKVLESWIPWLSNVSWAINGNNETTLGSSLGTLGRGISWVASSLSTRTPQWKVKDREYKEALWHGFGWLSSVFGWLITRLISSWMLLKDKQFKESEEGKEYWNERDSARYEEDYEDFLFEREKKLEKEAIKREEEAE